MTPSELASDLTQHDQRQSNPSKGEACFKKREKGRFEGEREVVEREVVSRGSCLFEREKDLEREGISEVDSRESKVVSKRESGVCVCVCESE